MKRKTPEIAPNAQQVLSASATRIAQWEADYFIRSVHSAIKRYEIESPIEQMLFFALMAVGRDNGFDVSHIPLQSFHRIYIHPQLQVGKYRLDFAIHNVEDDGGQEWIAVECDGHEFHDRNEQQRRYEKKRDRFLQQEGFLLMHFTGSEINQDPFKVAAEILQASIGDMITVRSKASRP